MIDLLQKITTVKTLRERLIFARELRGLKQHELAAKAHCSQGTIGNIESGLRNTLKNLVEVARVLNVSPDWLYDGKGPSPEALNRANVHRFEARETDSNTTATLYGQPQTWPFSSLTPSMWELLTLQQRNAVESVAHGFIGVADPPSNQMVPAKKARASK